MADTNLIDRLFSVGAHFAYSKSRRNPETSDYLFGAKGHVELFDLEKTAQAIESAKEYLEKLGSEGKVVLWVGSKAEAREAVKKAAEMTGSPSVVGRWIGGTLTNFSEIKKRIDRLADLLGKREGGELIKFTKLERLLIDREIDELSKNFGGIKELAKIPDALVVVDPRKEAISVREARAMKVPVVALLNSDCSTEGIEYVIPGNDASLASISFIIRELSDAYEKGKKRAAPAPAA